MKVYTSIPTSLYGITSKEWIKKWADLIPELSTNVISHLYQLISFISQASATQSYLNL